jgi:signal transduction histidine kinase
LVVDDEPDVLRSVYDLLRINFHVVTCSEVAEAIAVLESSAKIHVIMTDQRMPSMTGVELLRRAKEVRPETTRLLFTAYADIRAVVDAINQGSVFRYIAKPWDPEELEMVVRQAVEQYELLVEKARLLSELQASNERLLEANRLKEAFIEVASHELNTPVAVVLGMTELWKMSQGATASTAERGWIDRIQGAGKRLAAVVERMLKLIRTGEFNHSLSLHLTELSPLVRGVVAELKPYLTAREQTVELSLEPELGTAEVDPSKLADVLTNLVINAIKFTPDGGRIRVDVAADGTEHVRFIVTDSGVGISAAECSHLFEPFFTGFDTMHHSSGDYQFGKRGIGLGLCLVKTFVKMHGGTIDVKTAPGEGSTFAFTIPRRQSAPVPSAVAV